MRLYFNHRTGFHATIGNGPLRFSLSKWGLTPYIFLRRHR
jgi:hypothetical protein